MYRGDAEPLGFSLMVQFSISGSSAENEMKCGGKNS